VQNIKKLGINQNQQQQQEVISKKGSEKRVSDKRNTKLKAGHHPVKNSKNTNKNSNNHVNSHQISHTSTHPHVNNLNNININNNNNVDNHNIILDNSLSNQNNINNNVDSSTTLLPQNSFFSNADENENLFLNADSLLDEPSFAFGMFKNLKEGGRSKIGGVLSYIFKKYP
jgi:hypothetical protein